MSLYHDLIEAEPKLTPQDFDYGGYILLRNDADGRGDYIAKWEHPQISLPKGFTVVQIPTQSESLSA